MQPTSPAQFATANSDGVPELEMVRDNLYTVGLAQPGTLPHYSFSYLLLDTKGAVHVVDSGWDSEENWHRFTESLSTLGHSVTDVASVTITHLHPDHLGMAARIREASGATLALHAAEQDGIRELAAPTPDNELNARLDAWGVPSVRQSELIGAFQRRNGWPVVNADHLLVDGERLQIPGHSVRVMHTPGHTSGHLALVDELHEVVYLGDLLLPNQFPGIGLGGTPTGNPINHYLDSLATVAEFDGFEALPGHGYRFRGIAGRCAETVAHHEKRTAEVSAALSPQRTIWDVAAELTWTAGWENLTGLALLSALSQTALHADRASH